MNKSIVITGMGAVTPLGVGARTLYERWLAGQSGLADGKGEASEFDPTEHLSVKETRRADRFTQFALVAGDEALADAGWEREELPPLPAPSLADELRVVAQLKAQWILGRPSLYGLPAALPGLHLGETVYHPPRTPRGITRAAAAAARAHGAAADREAHFRRKRAEQFVRRMFVPPDGGVAGYLRMPVVTPTHMTPAHTALGIARSYPTTLASLPVVRERLVGSGPYPGAEELAARLVTLPTHSRVTPNEAARIETLAAGFGE